MLIVLLAIITTLNRYNVVCVVLKNKNKLKIGDNWLFTEESLEFFY